MKFKFLILGFFLPLFLYLSLYTWNWRTGHLDKITSNTGMEFVGWILAPGKWVSYQVQSLWEQYIALVEVKKENNRLKEDIAELKLKIMKIEKKAAEADRLRQLLKFSPPEQWSCQGVRVISRKFGLNAILDTVLINQGSSHGISKNMPAITPEGVIGRVLRVSPHYSTLLLITDPNSHIPVLGKKSRTMGILTGKGSDSQLQVNYIPQNVPLAQNEILLTSGLAQIFPKGLPVARITKIKQSELSLFKIVQAEPLVNPKNIEELLLLQEKPKRNHPK